MQASEISSILQKFPCFHNHFKGIFAIDKIPTSLKYREFFIGNTDVASGEGKHWFIVIKIKPKNLELFDSLGVDKQKQLFYINKLKNIKGIQEVFVNTTQFQSSVSSTCGQFALYFLINRLFNLDLTYKQFLKTHFHQSIEKNEHIVVDFLNSIT